MRITYVGYGDFHRYAGMKQLYHFAQEVARQGHHTQILIAGNAKTAGVMHESPLSEIVEMHFSGPMLNQTVCRKVQEFQPDIIHVWTPRHAVALAGWHLHRQIHAPVILDHEDDEEHLRRVYLDSRSDRFDGPWGVIAYPLGKIRRRVQPWLSPLGADGAVKRMAQDTVALALLRPSVVAHTAISKALVAYVRKKWPPTPVHLLYPGANLTAFNPQVSGVAIREQYGLSVDRRLFVYTGTLSLQIVQYFLEALQALMAVEPNVYLLLVGNDEFRAQAQSLIENANLGDHIALTGMLPYTQIPHYLAAADVLLQHPLDIGNDLRLPAKLPEYLAMGKPLVMFSQGIGAILDHGVHALKLKTAEPAEMSQRLLELLRDPALGIRLGEQARALAERLFDWKLNGQQLVGIYEQTLDTPVPSRTIVR